MTLAHAALAHPLRHLGLAGAALALVVVPLANPLLLSLVLILAGVLAAYRGAVEMLPAGDATAAGEVVFRHYF
ncbi:hypothetical protein [Methylobacterium trifolii]|uniref:Uncharacterized protein n=1 Tax=Methylobacterium trifolii TaxID=1003092 RepID=A0ABQ4TSZ9_9HYPH|nr:hypothetical protein [Methylobacterium trifolii]GJE58181.1 hypothetical protein MPOCJGCO_0260 [Methylobacterium trifolii]